jgi:hypothetical protein
MAGDEQAAEKQRTTGIAKRNIPQGLKPSVILPAFAARLKACPFKTAIELSFGSL